MLISNYVQYCMSAIGTVCSTPKVSSRSDRHIMDALVAKDHLCAMAAVSNNVIQSSQSIFPSNVGKPL